MADPAAREAYERERLRVARQRKVVAGLLLTFGGLFLLVGVLPVATDPLLRDLPLVGAGVLALWIGGILMGNGMGRRGPRRVG
ncbi:MAG: hypothetical protein ACREDK_01675 [Thermoplasmata archaeon]